VKESTARWSRRRWLAHCSVGAVPLLVAARAAGQGTGLPAARPAAAAPGGGDPRVLLIVGDSLSAEYGLRRGTGWAALLQQRLDRERLAWRVVNASISGDTTSGGRSRLPALLREHRPAVVVLELGGNDALRGLPMSMTRANLAEMTRAAKASGARVLIAGMQVPPNYGKRYADEFAGVFAEVARAEGTALVPFFLAGVADVPQAEALFQPDRIHPREEAHPIILANVWPALRPLLR
jgi:acyl-CoA thioesterase I